MLLELSHIHKSFDAQLILRDVRLTVETGEIVCLLGPSGSGKTTLLRIVAGLERADSGVARFDGRDLAASPIHTRGFGLMFQDLALFPHRNVFENVAFGLRMARLPRVEIDARVAEALTLVGLRGFERRDVNLLSGGEQQRVALARALAPRPRLLMFDEPLGALDRLLREQLIGEIRAILKQLGMTALYVTHDQAEAFAIADRIAILHEGQVAQEGAPEALYHQPRSAFVARFLDLGYVVAVTRVEGEWVETALGRLRLQQPEPLRGDNEVGHVLIRPERVNIVTEPSDDMLEGVVVQSRFQRGLYRVTIDVHGERLQCDANAPHMLGERVRLKIEAEWIG